MNVVALAQDRDLISVLGQIESSTECTDRDPWMGQILGDRYRIVRHLADGGMGKVYVGEQLNLGLEVAIKILDRAGHDDPALRGRFEREATMMAQLHCPHIVSVLDWGSLRGGGCYLVMELVPGADLATAMIERGLLGVQRTLGVLHQLAIAIDYAHAHGIVHRDLKPENVMIDERSEDFVKVLDFGVARDLRCNRTFSNIGEVVGTPEYMSPEQALGLSSKIGPASDRYALAALALEMLTGDLPYPSAPATTTLRMIVDAPPRRPSELGLEVTGLDAIFDRAMARRPSDRYPSARAFVDALERALRPVCEVPADTDRSAISGVRPRSSAAAAATVPAPAALAMSGALAGGALLADLPADDASMARLAASIVVAGLALVGSAFAAGWIACLILAG